MADLTMADFLQGKVKTPLSYPFSEFTTPA
jgi:hypothetical protein